MVYWTALTIGFLGSTHCVGMCGPIAMALPGDRNIVWHAFQYNLGRLLTYALLGLIMGLIGSVISFSGVQQYFSIGMGIMLLIVALFAIDVERNLERWGPIATFHKYIQKRLSLLFQGQARPTHLAIGFFNGFLPCGLVYFALAGALTQSTVAEGSLFMLAFGLGTFPLMLAAASAKKVVPIGFRRKLQKLIPVFLVCFGLLLIFRGVGVEVPEQLLFWENINNPTTCH